MSLHAPHPATPTLVTLPRSRLKVPRPPLPLWRKNHVVRATASQGKVSTHPEEYIPPRHGSGLRLVHIPPPSCSWLRVLALRTYHHLRRQGAVQHTASGAPIQLPQHLTTLRLLPASPHRSSRRALRPVRRFLYKGAFSLLFSYPQQPTPSEHAILPYLNTHARTPLPVTSSTLNA